MNYPQVTINWQTSQIGQKENRRGWDALRRTPPSVSTDGSGNSNPLKRVQPGGACLSDDSRGKRGCNAVAGTEMEDK
jgi:hypothetical protein